MTNQQALTILVEMQKWRRGDSPYDEWGKGMPYTPYEFGLAIDYCIETLKHSKQ